METSTFLWIVSLVLIVTGYAGLVIPALPGIVFIFAGFLTAAWAENFVYVGWGTISVLGLLAGLAFLLDAVAGLVGAKRFGAGRSGLTGAAIGTFVGMFFGIPGIVAGPFLGAVIGELFARKGFRDAGFAGLGTWLGLAAGAAVKIAIGFAMAGVFLFARFL